MSRTGSGRRPWTLPALYAVLLLSGPCGCRAEKGLGSVPAPDAGGAFIWWTQYSGMRQAVPKPAPSGKWAAVYETGARLRVWTVEETGHLREAILDSEAEDCLVRDCTWCGDLLVYCKTEGLESYADLDASPPPEGRGAYLAAHSATVSWDPATRSMTRLLADGFLALTGDNARGRLVACEPFSMWDELPPGVTVARVLSAIEDSPSQTLTLPLGGAVGASGMAWVLGWEPERDGFFAFARRKGRLSPSVPDPVTVPVLVFVAAGNGALRELSDTADLRVAYSGPWNTPATTLINGGRGVASIITGWRGRTAVALFDADGLQAHYDFGVRYAFPPGLADVAPWWHFIVCTRDGKHALFQETRDPRDPQDDRDGPWWVYLWDLEQETYEAIVQMNEIEYCFDWLSDTALIVGVRAEAPPRTAKTAELHDYGVLHLTKPDRETAPDAR